MRLFSILYSIFLGLFLVGCSHVEQKNQVKELSLTTEESDKLNREILILASERLEKMVEEAKKNQAASNFLASDLFLKANMSFLEGDFATAAALFKYVHELSPLDEFIQKKYAISLIRVGDLETAQVVLEDLYKQGKEERVGLILAGVYTGLDKEDESQLIYKKILAKNPKSEDACIFLGKSLAMGKQTKKAFNLLASCAQKNPKNGMYDYYIGKLYLELNQTQKAMDSFKNSLRRQKGFGQSIVALGLLYEEKEQYAAAIKLYENHLKTNPSDGIVLSRIVNLLFVKEEYKKVINYAEKLSDLEPDNLNLKVKLGILYTDAKLFNQALSVFKDLLTLAPQSDKILYYIGAIYQEMGLLEDAISYFNQIPESSGLYADSSIQLANMLSTLAQSESYSNDESTQFKEKFLKHVDNSIATQSDLKIEFSVIKAGFFEATGDFKNALSAMSLVKNEENFSTQHKYYLANLFEKEKQYEEATGLILSVLEKEPKNAEAWNFLGYTYLVRGTDLDQAYVYIQKAFKLNPDDGYIRDSLGWYYFKTGKMKEALKELTIALSKVPDDVEILKHIAVVYKEMKDFNKAKNFLEQALKNARHPLDQNEIQATIRAIDTDRLPANTKEN